MSTILGKSCHVMPIEEDNTLYVAVTTLFVLATDKDNNSLSNINLTIITL